MIPGRRFKLWDRDAERVADGGVHVTYGHWHDDKNGEWVEPPLVTYSDYSGSLIERSNLEEFVEQFAEHENTEWLNVSGGHGTAGLLVRFDADKRVPEIGEFFKALEDYPLANEDRHSQLEQEVQDEAWNDYGRSDFRRWMLRDLNVPNEDWEEMVDSLTDEQLNTLWWDAIHNGNGDEMVMEHQSVHFDFDRAFSDRDVVEDVRKILGRVDWGETLREYLMSTMDIEVNSEVLESISPETMTAFYDYLADQLTQTFALVGGPAFEPNPEDVLQTMNTITAQLRGFSHDRWAVLTDAMLEEGPDAFKPGHSGRKVSFGRRR